MRETLEADQSGLATVQAQMDMPKGTCMPPKRVLVTGATGQVGYMTYSRLRHRPEEYEVYALDRKIEPSDRVPRSWSIDIDQERLRVTDLSDFDGVLEAVRDMDVVVHLAADPEGDTWDSVLHNNVIATYNVFEASRQMGVSRIVAASSIMVSQGHREQEPCRAMMERRHSDIPAHVDPITPAIAAEPRSLYAASKVWTESLARVYSHTHGMSCICVRVGQVERDRPRPPQGADIYVSQRDIVQILKRCVDADQRLRFGVFYGMSNNDLRWVDINDAEHRLGYVPQDRAEDGHDYD